MRLDDYEEFNGEKPDEEEKDERNYSAFAKSSSATGFLFGAIIVVIIALVSIAVMFSFKKDKKNSVSLVNSERQTAASLQDESNAGTREVIQNSEEQKESESEMDETDETEINTDFLNTNDYVTAKDVVNLRSMPSVTNEKVEILGTLSAGEVLKRTDVSYEMGWSRLEYNGETVYAVTSYLETVENAQ